MAYDSARGRVVLFGGNASVQGSNAFLGDTWEWDGTSWTLVATTGPSPRANHALAYDSARGRVVLFGGAYSDGGTGILYGSDTWEWDGTSWTLVAVTGPGARGGHGMAYDSARGRTVLFGGGATLGLSGDTWEWNGASWTQVAITGPTARTWVPMAYDNERGRTVLLGGIDSSNKYTGDTWEWNGAGWTQVATIGPTRRAGIGIAYDSSLRRVLVFGGTSDLVANGFCGDTWWWDGAHWKQSTATGPAERGNFAMAYDSGRGRAVVFGGANASGTPPYLGDTWEWDGTDWEEFVFTFTPAARAYPGMAFDSGRGRTVLFGGNATVSSYYGDTWEWSGTSWAPVATTGPAARGAAAMAYDTLRGRTLMFGGGGNGGVYFGDTWAWNGSTWTQVATTGPSARLGHAMAYDSARDRVVLFGGCNCTANGYCGDTWEWNGSAWAQVATTGPSQRCEPAMAYDRARGRVVLFGGSSDSCTTYECGDTWEWDGSRWTQIAGAGPSPRAGHGMAYDVVRDRTVLIGGWNDFCAQGICWDGDVWDLDASRAHQPAVQFGAASLQAGIRSSSITDLRVRAFAGGTFYPGDVSSVGATLWGWSNGLGANGGPGTWVPIAVNETGVEAQAPYLPAPPKSLVYWHAGSAPGAQPFVTVRDGQLTFQVRPSGTAGPAADGAQVALDAIDVRVRYSAP
jgi:hypothetical protein